METKTCYNCGALTGVDPCWSCSAPQTCPNCSAELEGRFCTECGASVAPLAPAVSDPAGWAAVPPPTPAPPAGPPEEPTIQTSSDGFGAGLIWAMSAVRQRVGPLIAVNAVVLGIVAVSLLVVYIIIRIADELAVGPVTLLSFWLVVGIMLAACAYGLSALMRAWHSVALGHAPDLAWTFAPTRLPAVAAAVLILVPVAVLPFTSGLALVAIYYVVSGGLGPATGFAEAISRCTASGRAFFQTVVMGALISLYSMALLLLVSFMATLSESSALFDELNSTFSATSDDGDITRLLGLLLLAAVAIPGSFLLVQLAGLWSVAWARRTVGRETK